MHRTLLLGPPGTGKTHALMHRVQDYLIQGVQPKNIAFLTFTKNATNQAISRAQEVTGANTNFPYMRTLHSLAFREVGASTSDMLTGERLQQFARAVGEPIEKDWAVEELEGEYTAALPGTVMLYLDGLARSKRKPLEDVWREFGDDRINWQRMAQFSKDLVEFKATNFLYDFTDLIELYVQNGYRLPVTHVFVDEAQDLTPLQWDMVHRLSANAEHVIFAGDDDQTIYGWAGADPSIMQTMKVEKTDVLGQSYRCPRLVHQVAESIADGLKSRLPKTWYPRDRDGTVELVNHMHNAPLENGEWLILVRHRRQVPGIIRQLKNMNLPYCVPDHEPKKVVSARKAIAVWERLRQGDTALPWEVALVYDHILPGNNRHAAWDSERIRRELKTFCGVGINVLRNKYGLLTKARFELALDAIPDYERQRLMRLAARGEDVCNPRIRISTIHYAKGSEADNVLLFNEVNQRVYRKVYDLEDSEIRVWYVAVTRAREALWVVQSPTPFYFNVLGE